MEFIFRTESFSIHSFKNAREQLIEPLRKITELNSRKKLPFLWKICDKFKRHRHVSEEIINRRIKRYRIWGLFIFLMSLFLFIPSVTDIQELLVPLIVSSITMAIGLFFVFRCGGGSSKRLNKSAQLLINAVEDVKEYEIIFNEEGFELQEDNFIKYCDISLLTKTDDFYVIFFKESLIIFAVNSIFNSSDDLFEEFLSDKTGLKFEYCKL